MNDKEQVIKHLEIIQGIVNRLASNSFFIKGWSMTILAATLIFISKNTIPSFFILLFLIPTIGFWILDGYFLWQEWLFRGIYNDVRKQEKTDFAMDISSQLKKPNNKWKDAIFSKTLGIFYGIEIVFIAAIFLGFIIKVSS